MIVHQQLGKKLFWEWEERNMHKYREQIREVTRKHCNWIDMEDLISLDKEPNGRTNKRPKKVLQGERNIRAAQGTIRSFRTRRAQMEEKALC